MAVRARGRRPGPAGLPLDTGGEAEWANALAQRARATAELADALDADLERRGAARLLADVELPLVGVLAEMERAGIAADVDHLADMSATLGGEVKEAEQAAFAVTGHEFNLGSPKQLQEVLFTELGLPKTKRIKTGSTTASQPPTTLPPPTPPPAVSPPPTPTCRTSRSGPRRDAAPGRRSSSARATRPC